MQSGSNFILCRWIPLSHVNKAVWGASLVVQQLRLHIPNVEGPGSIPGQGTRFHMLQLKTYYSQINKFFFLKKLSFLSLNSPGTLVESQLTISVIVSFWTLF